MLKQRNFLAREETLRAGANMQYPKKALANQQWDADRRADALAQQRVDGIEFGEIGDKEQIARGRDPSGKALPNGNTDLPDNLLFESMGCVQEQMLTVWCDEKDRHVIHSHEILDRVKQSWEERIEIQMRDGGFDKRLVQMQLAGQELVFSGQAWRSIGGESAGGILIGAG
jgi:hypothetical protein